MADCQKTTLLGTIKEDFNLEKISISEAQQIAQNKREYQHRVDRLMSRKRKVNSVTQSTVTKSTVTHKAARQRRR